MSMATMDFRVSALISHALYLLASRGVLNNHQAKKHCGMAIAEQGGRKCSGEDSSC